MNPEPLLSSRMEPSAFGEPEAGSMILI